MNPLEVAPTPHRDPETADHHPDFRVIDSVIGEHLFVVDGSRFYDLDSATAESLRRALGSPADASAAIEGLHASLVGGTPRIDGSPLDPPALRSLSLNVAQGCNLSCGYCYADEGAFGGKRRIMSSEVARESVDRLLDEADPGVDVVIGFMGGEPLLNRAVIHETTRYATDRAKKTNRRVRFSLTTNGTLVQEDDAVLFADHAFSVSVSLDGPKELNDRMRPTPQGAGSYDLVHTGLRRLLANPPRQLSARITVTPESGRLLPILQHILELGFDDAGFAPVVASPNGSGELGRGEMGGFLEHMLECGRAAKTALLDGRRFPFTNFETALHEIHRGSHRPYPCGAGAAYLSVDADGDLFACHRLIDDPTFAMGSVRDGSDIEARSAHLANRHVDNAEPCRSCWARYLCGGGCYHEVDRRGRVACDYIRGWLEFCLASYAELSQKRPEYFSLPETSLPTTEKRV